MNTSNNQPRETEPSVLEMREIMDFTDKDNNLHSEDSTEVIDVDPIEENDSFSTDQFNPERNITKVSFRKNGKAKLALVSTVGLVAIIGGTTFFQGQMPKEKVAEAPQKKDPLSEQVEAAQSDATKAQQSESETKSELALSKQKDALEQANSNKSTDSTSDKTATDPNTKTDSNTKVDNGPAPSVPVVPTVKPSRANGFVSSPVVPPVAIPNSNNTKVATVSTAPLVPSASKNNISIPPAGVQSLPTISAPKLATAPVGALINKNASAPAPAQPLASAPGVPKIPKPAAEAPSAKPAKTEPVRSVPTKDIAKAEPVRSVPSKDIAKAEPVRSTPSQDEPTRNISSKEAPATKKRTSDDYEERPRLGIARIPGVPAADTQIASNTLPPPPISSSSLTPQPSSPHNTPPVAINNTPSFADFLKTSAAADTPIAAAPNSPSQLVAMNKDQTKEKQFAKDPKAVLQTVPMPNGSAAIVTPIDKKSNLIASNGSKIKYSGLISPNSLLTDITNAPAWGVASTDSTSKAIASAVPDTGVSSIKPALLQGVAPGINSTRPAYAHTKMLLAGLPDANISLGNVEQTSNQQTNQVNKSQVVTQNNPILNQPIPPTTVPNTPINPVSPTGPVAPVVPKEIATSILTGTSAKGTTLTPILWGADSANGAKFVAKLEEPLLANNKREALPAGTQLVVMARPSNNGNSGLNNNSSLVEVDVVSVIVQGKEYATPPGAIVIHDENNGLLVGEDYFKREDQIASRDYLTVLGGALNTLGQVLNRPSGSFSSNTSGFGSSSTNIINNRDPNIFGALLEGGFKDIPGIWNQRNQQALAQLANQPKVYQIPKGRTIRVFVNQSILF